HGSSLLGAPRLPTVHRSFPTRRSSDLCASEQTGHDGRERAACAPRGPQKTRSCLRHNRAARLGAGALITLMPRPSTNRSVTSVIDRKSTRLNSSHQIISYAVFCLKKKN